MSADEAGAIARRIYEAFNRRAIAEVADHIADDAEIVLVPMARRYYGPSGYEALVRETIAGFSDVMVSLTNQVVTDNQVANELVIRGTHDGIVVTPDGVFPPTGRTVEYAAAEIVRLRGDKVTDVYSYFDAGTIVRQLRVTE